MTNTSNSWKSQGGINRRSSNNILNNNKQSSSNLTIPQQFGISSTTIQQYGDKRDMDMGSIYKMTTDIQNLDGVIAYYPFNNLSSSNTDSLSNTQSNNVVIPNQSNIVNPSRFNLYVRENSDNVNNPYIQFIDKYSQQAIQFRNNSKCLISDVSLNTINAFGQTINTQSISTILTFETFIYIPEGTNNFCIFALDDINQTGLNTNGNRTDCFYLWYNKTGSTNQTQMLYYHTPSNSNNVVVDISNNSFGEITSNEWHKLMVVFGGSYIALYIDGVQTNSVRVGGGSYIPDKPIAFNLGSSSNILSTTNGTGPMLLDTKISLKANTQDFIEYLANPGNGHQYASNQIPNSNANTLVYLLSDEFIGFNAPITCETDVTVAGVLNSYGTHNLYAQSNFFDTAHFYGGVTFESNTAIVYDSSAVGNIEIYSQGANTNNKASLLIENAGGVSPLTGNNIHMPSMLVYNTINLITNTSDTNGLIFSISGDNVSVGQLYGQNTFDVGGNASFMGNVGIQTSNPSYTLDVSGEFRVIGDIIAGSNVNIGGMVGIGLTTSNPTSTLDISGSIQNTGDVQVGGDIRVGGDIIINSGNNGGTALVLGSNNTLAINYQNQFSGGTFIHSSLDVSGSITVNDIATFNNYAIFHGPVTGQTSSDTSGTEFATLDWINDYIQSDGGWIKEYSTNNIYNSNIGGNVGIGITNPTYTLDVSGDIHGTSSIIIDGDISSNGWITAGGYVVASEFISAGDFISAGGDISSNGNITALGDITSNANIFAKGKIGIGVGTVIDASFVVDISGGDIYTSENLMVYGKIGIGPRGNNQLGRNEPQATLDVGGNMIVNGNTTFNNYVYGITSYDSSGLEFATLDWVNSRVLFKGGWGTSDGINNIYNLNDGYVGIGTSNPQYKLDVSGGMNITGNATLNGAVTAPNANTFGRAKIGASEANTQNILGNLIVGGDFTVNGNTTTISTTNLDVSTNLISLNNGFSGSPLHDSGILIYRGDASNVFMGWGETSNTFIFGTTNATSSDTGNLNINPVDITVNDLTAIGKIGIGITSPQCPLDIKGDSGTLLRLQNNTPGYQSGQANIEFWTAWSNYSLGKIQTTDIAASPDAYSSTMEFYINYNSTSIDELKLALKLDNSGVEIQDSLYMNNRKILYAKNTSGVDEAVFWPRENDNATYLNYGAGGFYIRTNGNTSSVSTMFMTNDGSVGIGTNNPQGYKLSVNGGVQATSLDVVDDVYIHDHLYMNNGKVLYAKNTSEDDEAVFWPRWTDNATYLNYGTGGFYIRKNGDHKTPDGTPTMFMDNSGYVGIGTKTPTCTLDVSGNLNVTGTSSLNKGLHISGIPYSFDGNGVQPTGTDYPVEQGTNIQWNRNGNSGYTYIMNQKGWGPGGITFGDITDQNVYNELLFMGNVLSSTANISTSAGGINTNSLKIYPSWREGDGQGGVGWAAQTIGVNITPPDVYGKIYQLAASGGITGASAINFCADAESGGSDSAQFSIWTSPQQQLNTTSTDPLLQRVSVCGNGNVGIGVKLPTSTLDVGGTITASGNLTLSSGNLTLSSGSLIAGSTTISNTELSYLDGVSSNIQTQINTVSTTVNTVSTTVTNITSTTGHAGTISATSFTATGTISAQSFNATSDLRLKENINDLSNSLEKICAIRGVEYNWKADEEKKLHTGVIAQEVKEVIPEAVNSENEDKYSVDYNAIIGHLIEAVKTLKQEVDELKEQLKK